MGLLINTVLESNKKPENEDLALLLMLKKKLRSKNFMYLVSNLRK